MSIYKLINSPSFLSKISPISRSLSLTLAFFASLLLSVDARARVCVLADDDPGAAALNWLWASGERERRGGREKRDGEEERSAGRAEGMFIAGSYLRAGWRGCAASHGVIFIIWPFVFAAAARPESNNSARAASIRDLVVPPPSTPRLLSAPAFVAHLGLFLLSRALSLRFAPRARARFISFSSSFPSLRLSCIVFS